MSDYRAEVFVSYCWANESILQTITDHLYKKVNLHFDKLDIGEWKSIKAYMQSIPQMDYTILLISDKYLKSANCMYEVLEVMRDRNYKNKIFPVVIDKRIYDPRVRAEYVKYWQKQYSDLNGSLQGIHIENMGNLGENLKQCQDISSNIANFLDLVSDMNNPAIEDVSSAIEDRLKEEGIIPKDKHSNLWRILVLLLFAVSAFAIIFSLVLPKEVSKPKSSEYSGVDLTEEYRQVTDDDMAALVDDAQTSIVIYGEDGEYSLEDMKKLVLDRILSNPVYGDAVARGILQLENIMEGDIVAYNTWLTTFVSETDSAMDSPEFYMEGMRKWLVKTYNRISTRDSYDQYAEWLCIFLNEFSCESVDEFRSTTYWYIEPDASGIYTRAVENSQNTTRTALIMKYGSADGYIRYIFGIAIDDGSFCVCDPQKWGTDSFVE